MHPSDCPNWEYDHHPNRLTVLHREVQQLTVSLRHGQIDAKQVLVDTREIHQRLFHELTPPGCSYYAGHYRGEAFRCLRYHQVGIQGDPRVGKAPSTVFAYMGEFGRLVSTAISDIDEALTVINVQTSPKEKLIRLVAIACRIFEIFLRIHPYVNGNGHIARFCLWSILGRYNYWPTRWPIEPRPNDQNYIPLITAYRNGNREPLEKYILSNLSNTAWSL